MPRFLTDYRKVVEDFRSNPFYPLLDSGETTDRALRSISGDERRRVWYHLTERSNLRDIFRKGLLTSYPGSTRGLSSDEEMGLGGRLFLGRTRRESYGQLKLNKQMGLPVPKRWGMVLLKITLPKYYDIDIDLDMSGYVYTNSPIPPEFIEEVGK